MDNMHHLRNPGMNDSPVNTNKQWFQSGFWNGFRNHPQYSHETTEPSEVLPEAFTEKLTEIKDLPKGFEVEDHWLQADGLGRS